MRVAGGGTSTASRNASGQSPRGIVNDCGPTYTTATAEFRARPTCSSCYAPSANATGTVQVTRGDWPEAFRDAVLVPPPATLTGAPDPAVLAELDRRLAIVDAGEMTYRPAADVVADLRAAAAMPSPEPERVTVEQVLAASPDESLTIAPATNVTAPTPTPAVMITPGGRASRRDRKRQS